VSLTTIGVCAPTIGNTPRRCWRVNDSTLKLTVMFNVGNSGDFNQAAADDHDTAAVGAVHCDTLTCVKPPTAVVESCACAR
jgi:hypothetical protein